MSNIQRQVLIFFGVIIATCVALSLVFRVPYIYTLCGFATLAVCGHLVTLDDDAPGGWSNPDGEKQIWHQSLLELTIKFGVLFLLGVSAVIFPWLRGFGA